MPRPRFFSSLALALGLALLLPASPGAHASAPGEGVRIAKKSKKSKKKSKKKAEPTAEEKRLQIGRHLAMAEYLAVREGNADLARAEYEAVLQLDPNHLGAARALADLDWKAGNKDEAVARLEALAKKHPKDAGLRVDLADAKLDLKDMDGALKAYRNVVDLAPNHADARRKISVILQQRHAAGQKNTKELIAALEAYLKAEPHTEGLHYVAAERLLTELQGGKLALVIHDARTAYDAAWGDDRMQDINRRMGQARQGFEKCLQLSKTNQLCHYYLGMVHASVKASDHYDLDRATAMLSKAPDIPDAQVELAIIARKEGDDQKAVASLKRALKTDDRHQRAWLELGIHHKLSGEDDKAIEALAKAWDIDAGSSVAARALGEITVLDPQHDLVQQAMMFGQIEGDVFSSQKFKSAVQAFESRYGGVDRDAPEQKVLEEVLERILIAANPDPGQKFEIAVLDSQAVNAFAMPNGNMYFTKGFFGFVEKAMPDAPVDADNPVIAAVMAHEVVHVLRKHVVRSMVFRQAVDDANRSMQPGVLVHVTRIHEIEADREGMVLAFLAGYHPRGGISFMEERGKEHEIPTHLDHPTYDERIHYLEEFWSNDVKYAWMSFKHGLNRMDEAAQLGDTDLKATERLYRDAIDDFSRFGETLRPTKEVFNNRGVAYARLGIMRLADADNPMLSWNTRFSVERDLALKYVSIRGKTASKRGADDAGKYVPIELKHALKQFKAALRLDPDYDRAKVNLAVCYLAIRQAEKATETLASIRVTDDEGELANLRGVAKAASGDLDGAVGAFTTAVGTESARASATFNLARAHHLAGRHAKARKGYEDYLAMQPKGAWATAARRHLKGL